MLPAALLLTSLSASPTPDAVAKELTPLYLQLHQAPELAGQEAKTAATLATRVKALGVPVIEHLGGHGLVAVLQNGPGRTVLVRTDLDALPLEEKTGLPYASKVTTKDATGRPVSVMHACGHDVHMTSWLGALTLLARSRAEWKGTVVFVAQPAEETGEGAKALLADKLLERIPHPDAAVALHVHAELPSGQVGVLPGYALANVDSVDVTFFGKGGHGAYPHTAVDPILLASRFVVGVQALVAREQSPFDPAVVTVGSFHAGTRPNIIPDQATLQLTLRSYTPKTREALRAGVERFARAEADAARAPRPPTVTVTPGPSAVFNDPLLAERLSHALASALGPSRLATVERVMGAEDFSEYGARGGFPSVMIWLGTVEPARFEKAKASGEPLPALHSPFFAPDRDRTLATGVRALHAATLELLREAPPGATAPPAAAPSR
ncbi:MAG: amidohydrolase [Myxococcota bacterium]